MSRIAVVILTYLRHKPVDLIIRRERTMNYLIRFLFGLHDEKHQHYSLYHIIAKS
jgi:hypothetical protein